MDLYKWTLNYKFIILSDFKEILIICKLFSYKVL